MTKAIVAAQNLTKRFGQSRGVEDLSFKVTAGTTVGFLGPNGAGKSTTMNMLVGLTSPTSGSCTLFGETVTLDRVNLRNDIGFLASDMSLDGNLTGKQQLLYFAHLRRVDVTSKIDELARQLDAQLDRPIKTLSRGNRQKIGLIAALMHQPRLLLLDEPTSGLDPLIQVAFNAIIEKHRTDGGTTLISSHVLSEVEELCDTLIFIRDGKIIAQTSQSDLRAAAPQLVTVTTSERTTVNKLQKLTGVTNLQEHGQEVVFNFNGDTRELLRTLATQNISHITITDTDLEESFLHYYEPEEKL